MTVLYYTELSALNGDQFLKAWENRLDAERLAKNRRIKPQDGKISSLAAGLLLQTGVKEFLKGQEKGSFLRYRYGENGKPYLSDYPHIFFSISHSEKGVICALSDQEIGADIQKITEAREGIAERFFTEEEAAFLQELKAKGRKREAERLFFRLWSIKESYVKYTGKGLRQGFDSFVTDREKGLIQDGKSRAFFQELSLEGLPDYCVSLCMLKRETCRFRRVYFH